MDQTKPITPEELDQIDAYLMGRLQGAALTAFTVNMEANAALQQQVAELQLIKTGIGEVALRARLDVYHAGLAKADPTVSTLPIKKVITLRKWFAAAAAILLIITAGWWFIARGSVNERLYAKFYKADPGLASAMSLSDNYAFDRGMVDYKMQHYAAALELWEPMLAAHPESDTLNYFVAVARLAEGDVKGSIAPLQIVVGRKDGFFLGDARWYLGLALLKENRKAEAITMIQASDHPQKVALLAQLQHPE